MTDKAQFPDSIECSAQPIDLSFHPQREHIVAAALVDGTVEVHDFSSSDHDEDTILSSISISTHEKTSCRAVLFSDDASRIYVASSTGDVCLLDAERAITLSTTTTTMPESSCVVSRYSSGTNGIHTLHQLPEDVGNLLVTGDEQGCVSLWDVRNASKQKPVLSWKENTDYISGFEYHDSTLLASCADCTLSVVDLRMAMNDTSKRRESFRRSDDQEDELLSVTVMKHGKKVVCGTQEGVLAVWSWGTWGDVSDRFPGHPVSIDALLKVDEDTLLTGSSDGLVRLVQIHPDKLIGVLGDHDGYPIESLQFNSTRSFVGSVSHDPLIRLWDARVLQDDTDESDDEKADEAATVKSTGKVAPAASKPPSTAHDSDDEWDDMDGEDDGGASDDDDSDDSSSDDGMSAKKPKRLKTENEKFFEDL